MSDTFCIDDQMVLLALLTAFDNVVNELLFIEVVTLGKENILCTVSDTTPECDITSATSHNFYDRATLMRSGGITDLIDCFHCSIDCSIETDGVLG